MKTNLLISAIIIKKWKEISSSKSRVWGPDSRKAIVELNCLKSTIKLETNESRSGRSLDF